METESGLVDAAPVFAATKLIAIAPSVPIYNINNISIGCWYDRRWERQETICLHIHKPVTKYSLGIIVIANHTNKRVWFRASGNRGYGILKGYRHRRPNDAVASGYSG